jgi:hypothetical protein
MDVRHPLFYHSLPLRINRQSLRVHLGIELIALYRCPSTLPGRACVWPLP